MFIVTEYAALKYTLIYKIFILENITFLIQRKNKSTCNITSNAYQNSMFSGTKREKQAFILKIKNKSLIAILGCLF